MFAYLTKTQLFLDSLISYLKTIDSTDIFQFEAELKSLVLSNKDTYIEEARFDDSHYCKNILFRNDLVELVIIGWDTGQGSKVHNHPENGCLVYPIKGCLVETRYDNDINEVSKEELCRGDVSLMHDDICLHSLGNNSRTEKAISVHIYSPPNFECTLFEKPKCAEAKELIVV